MKMKRKSILLIKHLLLLFFIFIDKAHAQPNLTIIGQIKNFKGASKKVNTIEFFFYDLFLQNEIHHTRVIDSDGNFKVDLPLYQPQTINFNYFEKLSFFAKPGDKITIEFDSENLSKTIVFKGDEAKYNNTYQKFKAELSRSPKKEIKVNSEVDKNDAFHYKKLLLQSLSDNLALLEDFAKRNKIEQTYKQRIKADLEYSTAYSLIEYGIAIQTYPKSYFEEIFTQFPINNSQNSFSGLNLKYLNAYYDYLRQNINKEKFSGIPDAKEIATVFLKNLINLSETDEALLVKLSSEPVRKIAFDKNDTILFRKIVQTNWDLFQEKFPPKHPWLEYFLLETEGPARDIYLSWSFMGFVKADLLETVKPYFETYTSIVANKNLKVAVIQAYLEKETELYPNAILGSEHAQFINGIQGAEDSLFSKIIAPYKGRVVYIDFWGTWCGPCLAEMPYSRNLKKDLGITDVVFVYLGVDSPEKRWKQLIAKLGIQGEHYLLNNDEYSILQKQFKIEGIPRYILVSKDGIISDGDAMRPSDPSLRDIIIKLAEK